MASAEVDVGEDAFEDQRERVDDPMFRLFAEYGRPNAGYFAVGLATSVAARVLDLLPPLLLGIAIDSIIQGTKPFDLPLVPRSWLPTDAGAQFWLTAGLIVAGFLGGAAFHWSRNWGWNAFAQNIQHAVRTDTYDRMQRLNMAFFADKQTGEMMSVLSNDVNRLETFLNDGMNSFFRLLVMVLAIAAVLAYLNWQLALVSLLPVPLIAYFTYRFIETIQPKYAEVRASVGALNSRLENNLGGIGVIKAANTEPYESERVEDSSGDYFDANWDAISTRITFFPALRLLSGVGFVVTFVVGGLWIIDGRGPWIFTGEFSVGAFVTFILLTQRFIWPMAQFGQIVNMYQRARASAARIFGLMDEPARIEEGPDAEPLVVSEGAIEYDHVSFGYGDERVVSDVTFAVDGGETLGVVGPTGAGKSTLLSLLLRMYDVDEGEIRIDGQPIDGVTLSSLREAIGYVGQETFLFYGTVRENIAYGAFDATDEQVVEAAKAAEAHDFIAGLPDGYDTMVGERGVKLSGGQRQRIAIARAIIREPEILVFDEATSDVDTETEMLIQRSIDRLAADRTTVAVAHRLSTIKDADRIVVVDDGRVVESGAHEELIDADGLYAHLWGVQAGEIEDLPEAFVERAARRANRTGAEAQDD